MSYDLRDAIRAKFDRACYGLVMAWYNGEGVEQDYTEAAKGYRQAADQGLDTAE